MPVAHQNISALLSPVVFTVTCGRKDPIKENKAFGSSKASTSALPHRVFDAVYSTDGGIKEGSGASQHLIPA